MKRELFAAASSAAVLAGCAGYETSGEPLNGNIDAGYESPSVSLDVDRQAIIDEYEGITGQLVVEGMDDFLSGTVDGVTPDARYNPDNCVFYAVSQHGEEFDVITRNPVFDTYERTNGASADDDEFVEFSVYPRDDRVFVGTYTYRSQEFDDAFAPTVDGMDYQSGEVLWMQEPEGKWATVDIGDIDTDGASSWFETEDGTRVSETVIIPRVDGVMDTVTVDQVSEDLCGLSLNESEEGIPQIDPNS